MLKRLIILVKSVWCFFFGHKIPAVATEASIIQLSSSELNGFRHLVRFTPCERCIMFSDRRLVTETEWQKIQKKYTDTIVEIVEETILSNEWADINKDAADDDAYINELLKTKKKEVLH